MHPQKADPEIRLRFMKEAILPYWNNPALCAWDAQLRVCRYLTARGRTCVTARYMKKSFLKLHAEDPRSIDRLIEVFSEKQIFIPAVQTLLAPEDWAALQIMHDQIAHGMAITAPEGLKLPTKPRLLLAR